ncbi:MAG: YfhO family protein [Acidimicrobiaceae bacterium]|nr:YfhO family protein [Acidimicrobiaceae bacterium]
MRRFLGDRRLPALVAVAIVVFAFWRALVGGGSLVSHDLVATAAPFDAHRPASYTYENGPGDPINIHAHWEPLADDVRSGEFGWWNPSLGGGQPSLKAGVPIFNVGYLFAPGWFAPGLVAAIRALVAVGLMAGFLRAIGTGRIGALAGGLAFGFSGFMVGWMNWPHSSIAALAPGLLWALERAIQDPRLRRSVPIAAVVAAMVWANFPQVSLYVLLGAAAYAVVRVAPELPTGDRSRPLQLALVGVIAAVLMVGLAAPHLIGFSEYLDWADTSHRGQGPNDSSAGAEYLLSALAPSVWGADAVGAPWFGEGNWVEFNTHLGASVLLLALAGLGAGLVDRTRRSVTAALAVVGLLGVLVAYLGGPLGTAMDSIVGSQGGLMTRAKVLIAIAAAAMAGLGVDHWASSWHEGDRSHVRSGVRLAALLGSVAGIAMLPSVRHWFQAARAAGTVEESVATSTVAVLAVLAVVGVLVARWRRWVRPSAAGWALVSIVAFEVLFFAMPVPTIVSRAERLHATPAHAVVQQALDPGERLAGEGRTFFPATTSHFDIDDARGQLLKPPGYQELFRAVDPNMLLRAGGGTPTYPNIGFDADLTNPVWDAMAVGIWAQFPDSTPYGELIKPPFGPVQFDAVDEQSGFVTVPPGGLRAVVFDVAIPQPAFVTVTVEVGGDTHVDRRWRERSDWFFMPVALVGEHYEDGTPVTVSIRADVEDAVFVAAAEDGSVVLGAIAGGDDYRLIRAGDVLLTERLGAAAVRSFASVIVESDPVTAAALVAARTGESPLVAVVDRPVGLTSGVNSGGEIQRVEYTTDSVLADVASADAHLVVFSVNNYPGWSAMVDGMDAEIVTADATFIGVVAPAGEHTVELRFRPRRLNLSLAVFFVTVLVATLLWFRPWFPAAGRSGR